MKCFYTVVMHKCVDTAPLINEVQELLKGQYTVCDWLEAKAYWKPIREHTHLSLQFNIYDKRAFVF